MHVVNDKKQGCTSATEIGTGVKANLLAAECSADLKHKAEETSDTGQQVTFGDDLFYLAVTGLRDQSMVLFLDDFHTMSGLSKPEIAAQLKAAAEEGVKIGLAEVPHRADEPISANPDLTGRVAKIVFDYWSESDLMEIGRTGFSKLKVAVSEPTLTALAVEAGGSPQLMQLLCLEAAKVMGVEHELPGPQSMALTLENLEVVFINVVQEVEREAIFNILDNGPDERGKPRTKYPAEGLIEADNYEISLAAIALDPPRMEFMWDQGDDNLMSRIEKICDSTEKKPRREQISRALDQMVELAHDNMPKLMLLDWDATKGLHILDPYFMFFLRWSEKYLPVRKSIAA